MKTLCAAMLFIGVLSGPAYCLDHQLSTGVSVAAMTSKAEDQDLGYMVGFQSTWSLPQYYIALRPSVLYGKFGDVDFYFGSREGSNLTILSLDGLFGKFARPGNNERWSYYGIVGGSLLYMSRDYDFDRTYRTAVGGIGVGYLVTARLNLDLNIRFLTYRMGDDITCFTLGLEYYLWEGVTDDK